MSTNTTRASGMGYYEAVKGASLLFEDLNKTEGVPSNGVGTPQEVPTEGMGDLEILALIREWKKSYVTYYEGGIQKSQNQAFDYWIGKQTIDLDLTSKSMVDNKIFEAVETFIPIATRANPEPLVQADPGDLGQKLAKDIKNVLVAEADRQKLRKVLKGQLRDWLICRLGLIKIGFDETTGQIVTERIQPKRWMGDKDGHWDESGLFTGEWQAETKVKTAEFLIEMFPEKEQVILEKAGGKKGTKLEMIEWWYKGKDIFYTIEDLVLGTFKNPHWNYDVEPVPPQTDEMGNVITPGTDAIEGKNFLSKPTAPYIGLSIFSIGTHPHDETSLILQNVPIQDNLNKTLRQIDHNVDGMNNGLVVSDKFTDDAAALAASAVRKGKAIRAPGEDVSKAVMRLPPNGLPRDVFQTVEDMRNELRNIFGTSGSTPDGVDDQKTVRGKILVNQLDSSRIGGGITEYIEQVADTAYNFWVQMMFVHWTDEHFSISAGQVEGSEIIQIKNTDLALLKSLNITVKEGTLIPKDPLTQRNEAIDLWSAGAIDPITFYKKLDYADPMNAATLLLTWQMVQKGQLPPQAYLPNFGQNNPAIQQQQMLQQQMAMQGGAPQAGGQGGEQTPPGKAPPGVGDQSVNAIGPNTPSQDQAGPASPEAVQSQSRQLLQSVPTR